MTISTEGRKQINKDLTRFPQEAPKIYGEAVMKAAARLRDETKALGDIPVDTGRMRQSLNSRRISLLAAGVFVGTNYGAYVHEGTTRMAGRPFFRWALERGAQKAIDQIFAAAMALLPPK